MSVINYFHSFLIADYGGILQLSTENINNSLSVSYHSSLNGLWELVASKTK